MGGLRFSSSGYQIESAWYPPIDDDPMYGEYVTLSIEKVLEPEFEDIDSEGDWPPYRQ